MSKARDAILARLRAAPVGADVAVPDVDGWYRAQPGRNAADDIIERFCQSARMFRTEIHAVTKTSWPEHLQQVLRDKGLRRLLIGPDTPHGQHLLAHPPAEVELIQYVQPVEQCRDTLFDGVDAALTGSLGAIAETGSLILWPTPAEPRLMSLVPPVHIVLLDAQKLFVDVFAAMQAQAWGSHMPTNALLICGPSKTADIQQTLAYGAHGPRELVVLLVQSSGDSQCNA
ncbi:MAG: lactate utilization protein [Rhodoferax sp.]